MSDPAYGSWHSLTAMFFAQAKLHGDRPLVWAKEDGAYRPWSWKEVERQVRLMGRALRARGVSDGERVVLVSENRPEWLIADLAIMAAGGITVPAYTTNTEIDHRYIVTDSGAMAAIVSTRSLAQRVMPAVTDSHAGQFMVTMAPPEYDQLHEMAVVSWEDMLIEGAEAPDEIDEQLARAERDDVACFIYTSGTGGAPKGVMLTHRNILANCHGAHHLLKRAGLGEEVFLSFLPLSHAYEHTAGQFFPLSIGAQIYYAESADKLFQNLAEARPTIMTAVPRLYESLHQRIRRTMVREPAILRRLFDLTLKLGQKRGAGPDRLNLFERLLDQLAERFVRDRMRQRFGGRLKGMVSGGAALSPDVGRFFTALGLPLLQGYGQTEAGPIISTNPPQRIKIETVGLPLHGVEVKIAEDGEILVRGDIVMKGYWRAKDATAAALRDGWLHTGDVGEIDEDGYLIITDRKKDIIVFSGGDNVSPARIEGILTLEPEVSQAMVYGDQRPHLVALLVPEEEFLRRWAKSNGKGVRLAELAQTPDLHRAFFPVVERVNSKLSNLEKIRRFAISPEPFTVANGLMTPTLKIRRHKIRAAYGRVLEELY